METALTVETEHEVDTSADLHLDAGASLPFLGFGISQSSWLIMIKSGDHLMNPKFVNSL